MIGYVNTKNDYNRKRGVKLTSEDVTKKIAEIITTNINELEKKPMELFLLKRINDQIENDVYCKDEKNMDHKDLVFFRYFYCNFLEHIWFHLACDASLRVSDEKTIRIIQKVIQGLKVLSKAYLRANKEEIYNAFMDLTYSYFKELNSEENND